MQFSPELIKSILPIIGLITAGILQALFMRSLRNIKSLQLPPTAGEKTESPATHYTGWEILEAVLIISFTLGIGYLIWMKLSMLSAEQQSLIEPGKYLIAHADSTWLLPAMMLGLIFASVPIHFLYLKLLGKERYARYIDARDRKMGLNSWKAFRLIAFLLMPLCILYVLLALDTYARITDEKFVMNSFFSIGEKSYPFREIEFIRLTKSFKAPIGTIVRTPYYSIGFKDGDIYDFHHAMHDLNFDQQKEISEYVSRLSGIPVQIVDPYPE